MHCWFIIGNCWLTDMLVHTSESKRACAYLLYRCNLQLTYNLTWWCVYALDLNLLFFVCVQVRLQGLRLQPGPNDNVSATFMKLSRPFGEYEHTHTLKRRYLFYFYTLTNILTSSLWRRSSRLVRTKTQQKVPNRDVNDQQMFFLCRLWWCFYSAENHKQHEWYRVDVQYANKGQTVQTSSLNNLFVSASCCRCSVGFRAAASAEVKAVHFLLMKCVLTINWCWVSSGLLPVIAQSSAQYVTRRDWSHADSHMSSTTDAPKCTDVIQTESNA